MNSKLERAFENLKADAKEVVKELFGDATSVPGMFADGVMRLAEPVMRPSLKLKRLFDSETAMLKDSLGVGDHQTVFAFDHKSGETFMLVQVDEPHHKKFVWRKTRIAGFFVLDETPFPSIEAAVTELAGPGWECDFYTFE